VSVGLAALEDLDTLDELTARADARSMPDVAAGERRSKCSGFDV
jgi:hypothetical protein